ncbi:M14 family metallopeptidase [Paenibacillus gansuensis]|uniref:M14 family metallopeptidase n=1 Tax=Paenibacillus gansuensis TaxID=306542 RepID=A0ABW5PDI2_9BACL
MKLSLPSNAQRLLRRKTTRVLLFLFIVLLLAELAAPVALLQLSKPNRVEHSDDVLAAYPTDYDSSRSRFLTYKETLMQRWKKVSLISKAIGGEPGLYTDSIHAEPNGVKKNLLLITTGVHGVEGFVGSAMLDLLVKQHASELNPETTGILLVHGVNPWGMKHQRRYNENNVDLNRNFVPDWGSFDRDVNKDYPKVQSFLESDGPLGYAPHHELGFYAKFAANAVPQGVGVIADALLTGQYRSPRGVYYGGERDEPSTAYIKGLFREVLESPYENITHIDVHTGYGPRYQMSIFTTMSETMTEQEAVKAFRYPLVFTPDSEEFYAASGDISEYFYHLKKTEYPEKQLYSTCFEFGTLGDGTVGSIQSLRNTVDENRLHWYGASNETTEQIVRNRYSEMFYPTETKWRRKAADDFELALRGVLAYRGLLQYEE